MRVIVLVLVLTRSVSAQPKPQTRVESYRTTAAIVDGVALGLAIPGFVGIVEAEGGLRTLSFVATSLGVLMWAGTMPNVHAVKHDAKHLAYWSVILRLLPMVVAIPTSAEIASRQCPENETCRALELAFMISASASMVAGSVLDIAVLGEREIVIAPTTSGGATVGFAMTF